MEPNESSGLSSYYHQPPPPPSQHHSTSTPAATNASPTNGILPNTMDRGSHMVYPHSVPSAVSSPLETARRKRGRPRKYSTPEQAAAAKKLSSSMPISSAKKKEQGFGGSIGASSSSASTSSKRSQLAALGNTGQGFTPHIITVTVGEDVGQKIMLFMQQSKCELCILSASGSISNASLRQPATSGGNITYEGRFDILSLCGSFVRTELGGRTGGLSICLSSSDGHIIGGGVGGPLRAAGLVQVIVGTFLIDSKKETITGVKGETSAGKLPSPVGGALVSGVHFQSEIDFSGNQFTTQPRGMQVRPSLSVDWRNGMDTQSDAGYEFTRRTGNGALQSPENGDYE